MIGRCRRPIAIVLSLVSSACLDYAGAGRCYGVHTPDCGGTTDASLPDASLRTGPVLTVGKGQAFTTIASAVAVARDGDRIEVMAGAYLDETIVTHTRLTISGQNGLAKLECSGPVPSGAFITTDADLAIDHLEFAGASVCQAIGIVQLAGDLTIDRSYFHDLDEAIEVAAGPQSVEITFSEVAASGTDHTHAVEVHEVSRFHVANSYVHDTRIGHHIKSFARETSIENTRVADGDNGNGSYSVIMAAGGVATLRGNVFCKGQFAQNDTIVSYGGEGGPYSGSSLTVSGNVFESEAQYTVGVYNRTSTVVAQLVDNSLSNITVPVSGPANVSGDSTLSAPVVVDRSHPFTN